MHGAPARTGFKGHTGSPVPLTGKEGRAQRCQEREYLDLFIFVAIFFLSDVEFCSCSWQPATPEGNSSLWLPTREPCPCRVELDGAQTERSPARKGDRAVCATTEPHAQGSGNACGATQSCSQPLSLHCTKPAQKHLFYTTLAVHNRRSSHGPSSQRYSWIKTLAPAGPTLTAMGALNKALQPSLVLEQEEGLEWERRQSHQTLHA